MCGYGNRSLRVAARSLKVDNGPWRDRRQGPSGPIKRTDVPVSTPRARPSTAAKIIALKYGSPSRTAEMMMKTLTASPRCVTRAVAIIRGQGRRDSVAARWFTDFLARTAPEN